MAKLFLCFKVFLNESLFFMLVSINMVMPFIICLIMFFVNGVYIFSQTVKMWNNLDYWLTEELV